MQEIRARGGRIFCSNQVACVVRFAARLIFCPLNVTYLIASLRALSRAPRFACDSTVCQRTPPALTRAPPVAPSALQWRAPRARRRLHCLPACVVLLSRLRRSSGALRAHPTTPPSGNVLGLRWSALRVSRLRRSIGALRAHSATPPSGNVLRQRCRGANRLSSLRRSCGALRAHPCDAIMR